MREGVVNSIRQGIRESIVGSSGSPVPSFSIPLQTDLTPAMALVSAPATFTRATTATVEDYLGRPLPVLAGEARFKGARRVRNLITASEDMTNGAYAVANNAVVDSATQATFDGTAFGQVQNTPASGGVIIVDDGSGANGRQFVFSVSIRVVSGTISADDELSLKVTGNAVTAATLEIGSEVNSTQQRFSVQAATDAAGTQIVLAVECEVAATLEITQWMVEETTGNDDTTIPSEYVSTGVGIGADIKGDLSTWSVQDATWVSVDADTVSIDGSQVSTEFWGNSAFVIGKDYVVDWSVDAYSAGNVSMSFDAGSAHDNKSAAGDYIDTGTVSANTLIYIRADANFSGTVTINSIKEADHGANRDGVKYFSYKNGNSVSSGVVTEAQGSPIGASDSYADADGPYGYDIEGARTNLILQSQNLGTTWVNSLSVDTQNYAVAPDGTTTANRVIDDSGGGTGTPYILQGLTIAADTDYTWSVYMKADQLSRGIIWTRDYDENNGTYFDLSAGTVGTIGAAHSDAGIKDVGNGWYRCWIVYQSTADVAGTLRFSPAEADAQPTVDRDGTSSILVWGAQVE